MEGNRALLCVEEEAAVGQRMGIAKRELHTWSDEASARGGQDSYKQRPAHMSKINEEFERDAEWLTS